MKTKQNKKDINNAKNMYIQCLAIVVNYKLNVHMDRWHTPW